MTEYKNYTGWKRVNISINMFLVKLLLISCLCYTAFSKEEDVIDLGDSDFSTKLAEHETALVMFYAPW